MTTIDAAPELSVVVPAYNEVESIAAVVANAAAYLSERAIRYEINVVDDGSRDGTARVLEQLKSSHAGLRIVRHDGNRGYGAAIRSGIASSRGTHILVTDGDGQFSIDDLAPLWGRRHLADIVLGYRDPRRDPPPRRLAGWLYNRLIIRLFLGGQFRDVNCGFKLLSRQVVQELELESTGALISAELLTRARLRGATFAEVGVRHFPRCHGTPTGLLPRVVFRMVRELFMLRGRILRTRVSTPTAACGRVVMR